MRECQRSRRLVFGRIALCALALGMLAAVCLATTAYGLTNSSAVLDVGAGEHVTIDGARAYTTSVNIHDGGYVYVGGSGHLTLISPSIIVESGGVIFGTALGADGIGASISLECTTLHADSGIIIADGRPGQSWPWDGRAGGSITVTATREVQIFGPGIYARGGNGYSLAGNGGGGGSVRVVSPRVQIAYTGTISVNGGSAAHLTGYDGGDAGNMTFITGRYEQPSAIYAHGGNASSQDTPFGIGGDGGDGGTVTITADAEIAPAGAIDVGGGLPGTGEERDGVPGATGTIARTVATNAPYDVAPVIDGYVPPGVSEYYLSWYWPTMLNDSTEFFVHENGVNLNVGARRIGTVTGYIWLTVDTNNNGGTAPQTDDRAFLVGTGGYRGFIDEYVGTGTAWTHVADSGWWGTSGLQAGPSDHCEWQIPLTGLGISPGTPKTLGMAMAFVSWPGGVQSPWPAGSSYTNPSTWPDLSSFDNWTLPGNTVPAGWTGFTPTATNTASPSCSVQVSDGTLGLDVSTAQYRYSTNSGSSWSSWATAGCTGTDGTTSVQTLSASAVPLSVSLTANRVQFRVFDMGGALGETPQYTVAVDPVIPTPWAGFSPVSTVTNTLAPNCGVTIRDAGTGLGVSTAQYQYSTNGGSSWSGWLGAGCTGTSGTTAVQTVTAYAVPFMQNSLTANRVRFRITDLAGNTATSGTYTVPIEANVFGLPINGDFEFGAVDSVPLGWQVSTYIDQPVGEYTSAQSGEIVSYAHFHAAQAAFGEMLIATYRSGRSYVAERNMKTSAPVNLSGTSGIDLVMTSMTTNITGTTPSDWDIGIAMQFKDSVNPTQTVYLYRNTKAGGVVDSRTGTASGADGATWSLYHVTVPGGLDLSSTTISLTWRVAATTTATDNAFRCGSLVDWIRVVDVVPPASSASISGAWWSGLTRDVSFTATDYVGLASVQLWKRSDTGSGFGPWVQDQSRSAIGTSSAGTFTTDTPLEGRYEFYTRAVDSSGNVEAAPGVADAWCAVDRTAPTFGNLTPSGWISDLTPSITIDVRDAEAGLGLTPQVVGTLPEHLKATTCAENGTAVYTGAYATLSALDIATPSAPAEAAAVDLDGEITDLAMDSERPWLYAALGNAGVGVVDVKSPLAPEPAGTTGSLGNIQFVAASSGAPVPLVFLADSSNVWILEASQPDSRMFVLSRLEFPDICDIAFHNGLLYVASSERSLWTVDVRNPEDPRVLEGPAIAAHTVMAFQSDLLYLVDGDAMLMVYDVSRAPDVWVPVTHSPIDGLFDRIPNSVRVSGDRLYATVDGSEVSVIDVGDPSAPSRLCQLDGGTGLNGALASLGRQILTFNGDSGMRVWQLTEPAYRWSSSGGKIWSDWFAAQRSYSEGTNTTETLTATRAEFEGDSDTQNVVEFATGDTLLHLGTSGAMTIRVDTAKPRVMGPMSSTHTDQATWYPATTVNATWGDYVDLSGTVGYAVGWDDSAGTVLPAAVTTTTASATKTGATEGVHYLHVRPVDAAGNWGDTAHMLYRVDFNAPTAPTGLVFAPTSSSTNTFTASWTNPAQAYAPLNACYYKLDAAPTSATDGTLVAGSPTSISGITASSEGTHTLYVWLRDSAGNTNHSNRASATFVYDASAPGMPAITSSSHPSQSTWYSTSPALLSWVATDSVSAIDAYSYGLDSDPAGEPDMLPDAFVTSTSYNRPGDGAYYFHVRARNAVGMWGATSTYTIRWDTSAPNGTMSINNGSAATSQTVVTVNSSVTDLSAMTMRVSTSGGATWTVSVPYAATMSVSLPAGDGEKTVIVAYTDSVSHTSSLNDTIILDTTGPAGGFVLNANDVYTRSTSVTATASVTDLTAIEMRYSVNSGSTWTAWEPYAATKALTLAVGDGAKTALGQFRDAFGHLSEQSDAITLDATLPTVEISSVTHPTSTTWYDLSDVDFEWTGADAGSGVTTYSYALNTSAATPADTTAEGSATTRSYTSVAGGVSYFHLRALDLAGNWGADTTFVVRIDTTNPTGPIAVNGGAPVSSSANVTVNNSATDVSPLAMQFSVNGKSTWTTAEPYAATKALALPAVEGTATIWARFTDQTGHFLETSDEIVLDLTTEMDRIAGGNRYETAAMVSAANFAADSCDYVVIATGAQFPDALGAAGLAGSYECPLLLTDPKALPSAIRAEIVRIGATDCFVIGSTAAVADAVKDAIDAIPGMNTPVRLQGTNRYETAAAVAQQIAAHEGPAFSKRAFIARGDNFADALAASPLAYSTASPVLLVQTTALPTATRNSIVALGITDVVIAGSDKAVGESVKTALDAIPGVTTPVRVFGADRYATAAAVATYGVNQSWATWEFLGVATGQNFPDALGGGAACGAHGGVLLLTSSTTLSTPCRTAIVTHASDIGTVQVFGGTSALSAGVYSQILGLVQ